MGLSAPGRGKAGRTFRMRAGPVGQEDDAPEAMIGDAVRDQGTRAERLVVGMGREHKPARLRPAALAQGLCFHHKRSLSSQMS